MIAQWAMALAAVTLVACAERRDAGASKASVAGADTVQVADSVQLPGDSTMARDTATPR